MKNTHICPKCNGTDIILGSKEKQVLTVWETTFKPAGRIFRPYWYTVICAALADILKNGLTRKIWKN